ncbi:UDP-N-acetylglucosamine 1-carboxyvinyltransferase [Streptosporangium subroseum]|uniref:UDP-N-acetylglucosamine 1-carboxyvinyltransferase n=1 Tax=Streptosporangium subroseum TaxID=106412 RepID=A0A239JLX3_9ACTN|nr:UDP-N-acetylglucosamine 1-carboxyvinyltransferase [Streptosporangium subroseum]SNT06323.1 UDP-N-acetylglucosamine 1-carboxyvinyltransferase [Streptosporangium subroseum]
MTTSPRAARYAAAAIRISGGRPLTGRIAVQGSKNIALHLYAAILLADEPVTLHRTPNIIDTQVCARILRRIGADVEEGDERFAVTPANVVEPVVDLELGRRVRTTAVLGAAVLSRAGRVTFPLPGGDAFCPRYIDRHLAAMSAAGAEVSIEGDRIRASFDNGCPRPFRTDVDTRYGPSLGATVSALLLAARAPGTSLITHPSIEPEVLDTAQFLASGGVDITLDHEGLHVTGTDRVGGGVFTVAGDRIEAATMLMAAAATGGNVHLEGIIPAEFPEGLVSVLADAGIALHATPCGTYTMPCHELTAVYTATGPHPGLPTDTQPQLTALLTQARGVSRIEERVYPRRDTHVAELRRFGAILSSTDHRISVHGPIRLHGAEAQAEDIRAVTALVIAALIAPEPSTIRGMYHLRRGYGRLLANLATLGADISTDQET